MRRFIATLIVAVVMTGCSSSPEGFEELKSAGLKAYLDGDYVKSREYLRGALDETPSDKECLYFTGLSYKHDFYLDSAFVFLKRADLYAPDDREMNQVLLEVAVTVGEWKAAQEAVMTLVRTGDPVEQHYGVLHDLWYNMGSVTNSFYYLHLLYLEVGIDRPEQFEALAGLAAQMDSLRLANAVLDSAVTLFGSNDNMLFVEAKIRFHERNHAAAESILSDLVARYPESPDYKINLANALANTQIRSKQEEALRLYQEVRLMIPNGDQVDSLIVRLEAQMK